MRHTDGFTLEKAQSAVARGLTIEQAAIEFNASPKRVWFFARKHNLLPAFEDSAVKAGIPMFKPDSVIEGEARAKAKLTGRTAKKAEAGTPATSPRRAASADPDEIDWPYALKLMDRVVQDELASKPQQLTKREAKLLAIIRAFFTRQVMPPIVDMLKTGKGVTIVTNPAITPAQVVVELTETLRGIAQAVQDGALNELTEDEVDLRNLIPVLAGQLATAPEVSPLIEADIPGELLTTLTRIDLAEITNDFDGLTLKERNLMALLDTMIQRRAKRQVEAMTDALVKPNDKVTLALDKYREVIASLDDKGEQLEALQIQVNDLDEKLSATSVHRHQMFGAWTGKAEYEGVAHA